MLRVAAILMALSAPVSSVTYQPLDEAVLPTAMVFRAKVVATSQKNTRDDMTTQYVIDNVVMIRGKPPVPVKTASYTEVIPVMRDAAGNVVGHFSPILNASGIERDVSKGAEVYVFTNFVDKTGNAFVFRMEPIAKKAEVDALLKKQAMPSP